MPTSQEAVSAAMLPGTAAGQGASSRCGNGSHQPVVHMKVSCQIIMSNKNAMSY
jgi:hypothetical protein